MVNTTGILDLRRRRRSSPPGNRTRRPPCPPERGLDEDPDDRRVHRRFDGSSRKVRRRGGAIPALTTVLDEVLVVEELVLTAASQRFDVFADGDRYGMHGRRPLRGQGSGCRGVDHRPIGRLRGLSTAGCAAKATSTGRAPAAEYRATARCGRLHQGRPTSVVLPPEGRGRRRRRGNRRGDGVSGLFPWRQHSPDAACAMAGPAEYGSERVVHVHRRRA